MVGLDDVVIVDIRDFRERQRTGYIRDSFHCPRGMAEFWVDPESPYFKPVFDEKKHSYFIVLQDGVQHLLLQPYRKWE